MGTPVRMSLNGMSYEYRSDQGWVDCDSNEVPPAPIVAELNRLRLQELQQQKARRDDPAQ